MHVHRNEDEGHLLDGQVTFHVGTDTYKANPGIVSPTRPPHTSRSRRPQPACGQRTRRVKRMFELAPRTPTKPCRPARMTKVMSPHRDARDPCPVDASVRRPSEPDLTVGDRKLAFRVARITGATGTIRFPARIARPWLSMHALSSSRARAAGAGERPGGPGSGGPSRVVLWAKGGTRSGLGRAGTRSYRTWGDAAAASSRRACPVQAGVTVDRMVCENAVSGARHGRFAEGHRVAALMSAAHAQHAPNGARARNDGAVWMSTG